MGLSRRGFLGWSAAAVVGASGLVRVGFGQGNAAPDFSVEIGPCTVEASPKHVIKTMGYNGVAPGPLIRMREGRPARVAITNKLEHPEIVHWHGLFNPVATDGAMEEGSPMLAPGERVVYEITPRPAGFRWYHTHTFAGGDLRKAQYSGLHGFLYVDSANDPGEYDQELFLDLHDWEGHTLASDDGAMNPVYDVTTINGKMLGFGEPVRVKQGGRLLVHMLNSSPSEVHWIAFAGHSFEVVALDGNPVPVRGKVGMLRLAPAERICALVEMNNPGMWVLGEVRKHVQASGMGVVVEYAGAGTGKPVWQQPEALVWNYEQFGRPVGEGETASEAEEIPLVLESKFKGHGAMEDWMINGKVYPHTDSPVLVEGRRYRLRFINKSQDEHPMHLHRHSFELIRVPHPEPGSKAVPTRGVMKDVVLVPAASESVVEFVANNPGNTLMHCHQQNHMDLGFMMVFRYA